MVIEKQSRKNTTGRGRRNRGDEVMFVGYSMSQVGLLKGGILCLLSLEICGFILFLIFVSFLFHIFLAVFPSFLYIYVSYSWSLLVFYCSLNFFIES